MALSRQEQEAQRHLDTLDAEYKVAAYATPRDEQRCLALAEQMLVLARGTRIEAQVARMVKRHQPKA